MSVVKIDVLPDLSVTTGGHAIIRLRGVALLPPGATFRIDPIDDALNDNHAEGWPHGDHHPIETRQTPEGIEMRVGPNIVDAPLLEPGTPVTISVPDGKFSGDIVWPDIPLSNTASFASVLMTPSQMAAELAANERAKAEAARLVAEEKAKAARAAEAAKAQQERDLKKAEQANTARQAALEQQRMMAAARDLEAALAVDPVGSQLLSNPNSLDPSTVRPASSGGTPAGKPSKSGPAKPSDAVKSTFAAQGATSQVALSERTTKLDKGQTSDRDPSSERGLSRLAQPSDTRNREQRTAAGDARPSNGHEPAFTLSPEREPSLPSLVLHPNPSSPSHTSSAGTAEIQSETLEGRVVTDIAPRTNNAKPFLAGAGIAAALAAVLFLMLGATKSGLKPNTTLSPAGTLSSTTLMGKKSILADAFTAGPQSPRGDSAIDVDLPTALRLADYNLHGIDRAVDRAEAEFWLKKALALTTSHSQIRWAVTQLGTLAAEPVSGAPDYEKARALWEISASNGDPVAMCFLGTLLENGLGTGVDRAQALSYFHRAKDAGGCPTGDEAIARLSK
jgi:TPR repeat protein